MRHLHHDWLRDFVEPLRADGAQTLEDLKLDPASLELGHHELAALAVLPFTGLGYRQLSATGQQAQLGRSIGFRRSPNAGSTGPTLRRAEVLVKVLAISVNPADWHSMRGKPLFSRATLGVGLLRPKHEILGVDIAGRVEAVGSGVTQFKSDDEVSANLLDHGYGSFAE
jgi:Alcohol dehydrogenase GroES-like domain